MRHQRAAIDLRKSLAEAFPKQLSYRIDLSLSLSNLGNVLARAGQNAQALDSVREANAIQRRLVHEHPDDPQLQSTLALSTRGLAILLNALGRWKESRPLYVEPVEIMDRLVAQNPAVTEFRRVLATAASELGQLLIDHDEIEAGLAPSPGHAIKRRRSERRTRMTAPASTRWPRSIAGSARPSPSRARQPRRWDHSGRPST